MVDDHPSNPGTEPFVPDFEQDPGTQSWVPDFDDDDTGSRPRADEPDSPAAPEVQDDTASDATAVPVQPITVPGRYRYLRWWQLVLALVGVWLVAAVVGLGLFSWWYHSVSKTPAVFTVVVYVVVCAVAGVLLAMAEGRPLVSALSVAVMSAPFGALAAAAPLYGYYHGFFTY